MSRIECSIVKCGEDCESRSGGVGSAAIWKYARSAGFDVGEVFYLRSESSAEQRTMREAQEYIERHYS